MFKNYRQHFFIKKNLNILLRTAIILIMVEELKAKPFCRTTQAIKAKLLFEFISDKTICFFYPLKIRVRTAFLQKDIERSMFFMG